MVEDTSYVAANIKWKVQSDGGTPKRGRFLTITVDSNYFHVREIEVWGYPASAPSARGSMCGIRANDSSVECHCEYENCDLIRPLRPGAG